MVVGISGSRTTLDSAEEKILLKVEDIADHSAENDVDEAESNEDKEDGKNLGGGSGGGDVTISDCAHGDDAEVEGIDDRVSLDGGEILAVEGIYKNTEGEVDGKEDDSLADDGGGLGFGEGRMVFDVIDAGHSRGGL